MSDIETTHGILSPDFTRFSLERIEPTPALAPFVEWFWIVRWDLSGAPPYEQEVLPHPCVNLSIEDAGRSAVHGPANARFLAHLEGVGRVAAAKFRPEGFFAFARVPMTALVDRMLPIAEAMDPSLASLLALETEPDPRAIVRMLEERLCALAPRNTADVREVGRLVAAATTDRSLTKAEQLATLAGISVRTLQRSFERVVGLSPKWILRRARVHEAAERMRTGEAVDWAALAQDLGYHDQSHFIRDFKDQVGWTPVAYVARARAAASENGPTRSPSVTREAKARA